MVVERRMRLRCREVVTLVLMASVFLSAEVPKTITVGPKGADFTTIQAAVNAAPDAGAVIRIRPGVYREVVHVEKPGIEFRGRSEERRVGKECLTQCRSRWSPYH